MLHRLSCSAACDIFPDQALNSCSLRWQASVVAQMGKWSSGKESAYNAGDPGSVSASGRSLEGGYGNPLQYPRLENSMGRGAWWARVHGVEKSRT